MPVVTQPNSYGEPATAIQEKWSSVARAAAAMARRRRKTIKRLERIRMKSMDRLLNQINSDNYVGVRKSSSRGNSLSSTASKYWMQTQTLTGHIERLRGQKVTANRPLIARLKKKMRSVF